MALACCLYRIEHIQRHSERQGQSADKPTRWLCPRAVLLADLHASANRVQKVLSAYDAETVVLISLINQRAALTRLSPNVQSASAKVIHNFPQNGTLLLHFTNDLFLDP